MLKQHTCLTACVVSAQSMSNIRVPVFFLFFLFVFFLFFFLGGGGGAFDQHANAARGLKCDGQVASYI